MNIASLQCVFTCHCKYKFSEKEDSRTSQVYSFSLVCDCMFFQIWIFQKRKPTHYTIIWSLPSVCLRIAFQIWLLWDGKTTHFSWMWFLSSVSLYMVAQLFGNSTHFTRTCFFARMHLQMFIQIYWNKSTHISQKYCFSLMCICIYCMVFASDVSKINMKAKSHAFHVNMTTFQCVFSHVGPNLRNAT